MEKRKKGHGCLISFIILVVFIIAIAFGGYKFVISMFDGGLLMNGTWDCDGKTVAFNNEKKYTYDNITGSYSFDHELISTGARYNVVLKSDDDEKKIIVDIIEQDNDIFLKITDDGVIKTCRAKN